MKRLLSYVLSASMLAWLACDDQRASSCACTTEFVSVYATVFSQSRFAIVPVTQVQLVLVSTQETLSVQQDRLSNGTIRIVDDSVLPKISQQNDLVRVTGVAETGPFEAHIEVGPDGPCRCHIRKVSGPTFILTR